MDTLRQDLRYAWRSMLRTPGFTAIVVLTLALGIGANTAIFSVVHALLLRPLPYPEPEELVTIFHHYPSLDDLEAPVSAEGFREYRDGTRSFEAVAVQAGWAPNLTGVGQPVRLAGIAVSAAWFRVYGVEPALGRVFLPEENDPGRDRVVLLTDGLWKRRFGADPAVIGRTVHLNGEAHEVVGVLKPGFRPVFHSGAEILAPLALTPEQLTTDNEWLPLSARLAPGVTVAAAQAEMRGVAEGIKAANPGAYPPDWNLRVETLDEMVRGDLRPVLLVLLGAVGFVLLIACVNVANLLLARGLGRLKDVSIRVALGAPRRRIIRQLLVESILLAAAGGAMGLLLAFWALGTISAWIPPALPGAAHLAVNGPVLAFALFVSLAAGLLFGLAPALHTASPDVQSSLREGGRSIAAEKRGRTARRMLVVGEIALALTLLVGAGLLIKSFARLSGVDPGFDPEGVLTFGVALPAAGYPSDTATAAFFDAALRELRALPGVEAAGAVSVLPFGGGWSTTSFTVEGFQPGPGDPPPWGDFRIASPGYARAMGIPLIAGRFLQESDRMDAPPVVVVDEEMVGRYWPDETPIGKRITFDDLDAEDLEWITVVGVVGHTKQEGLDAEDRVQMYFSYRQAGTSLLDFTIRTAGDPNTLVEAVGRAIRSVDANQPIADIMTMEERIDLSLGQRRVPVVLLGAFAGLALLLAALGIYGVMSHLVEERTRELGVRMAFGAGTGDVLRLVLRQGLGLTAAGLGIGLAGALLLTRLVQSQLYGVRATDPMTYVLVALTLAGVALVATAIPARRAAGVPPTEALRYE